ncbi:MAG: LysE family translocator [Pseudomonadota bacterium]
MFDYSMLHWTTFLTATVLLTITPGPDIAFILGQTVRGGQRSGFAAMFGVWTGAFGHVVMAAAGLSAVIATSAVAFSVVKWVGVLYLLWLGISALRSDGGSFIATGKDTRVGLPRIFKQGVFVALLNPKVAIFFLAFLPQFVVDGAGPVWAQLLLHGFLIIFVAAFIEPPLIMLGDKLTDRLRNSDNLGKWLDRTLGAFFVALGIRLAMEQR